MQIISLNTWGGKQIDALKKFIEEKAEDTDIFCFQEIFSTPTENKENNAFKLNLYQQLQPILKDFNGLFAPTQDKYVFFTGYVDFELSFGLSIFVKKNIKILSSGDIFVFRKRNGLDPKNVKHTIPRNMQYIQFSLDDKDFWVCNLHGFWFPGPKTDTPERIEQSKKIIEFLDSKTGEKILCGDFNLALDTESVKILEGNLKNLIREYNISTTRNKLYDRTDDKFADYTFVSPEVKVIKFEVPNIEVSDHLPMILEFTN
ncbi:hypothetical protein A3A45_03830 [Candidatus Daviesbacteria bacterium RIFCSPLOWO2_01_FULL_36_8]|nr:MAG: hypothetical protein A3A45_03830 [Candidatus Daviesbacteria bacterium RIFCSPLOWO2_01_FULL_36_8]